MTSNDRQPHQIITTQGQEVSDNDREELASFAGFIEGIEANKNNVLECFNFNHMNDVDKENFQQILTGNCEVFLTKGRTLGCTRKVQHQIITDIEIPVTKRPYRESFQHQKALQE